MWWVKTFTNLGKWSLQGLRLFCRIFNRPLIEVHYDCGLSHKLYIRGELPELSWSCGKELINMGPTLWVWVGPRECQGPFKILLDDHVYEDGANHQLLDPTGATLHPTFSAKDYD